eukprot:9412165-Alexandrium_andersonii.AAC.2
MCKLSRARGTVLEGVPHEGESEHHGCPLQGQRVAHSLAAALIQPQADHPAIVALRLENRPVVKSGHA